LPRARLVVDRLPATLTLAWLEKRGSTKTKVCDCPGRLLLRCLGRAQRAERPTLHTGRGSVGRELALSSLYRPSSSRNPSLASISCREWRVSCTTLLADEPLPSLLVEANLVARVVLALPLRASGRVPVARPGIIQTNLFEFELASPSKVSCRVARSSACFRAPASATPALTGETPNPKP
jgi:hypothetical protein